MNVKLFLFFFYYNDSVNFYGIVLDILKVINYNLTELKNKLLLKKYLIMDSVNGYMPGYTPILDYGL